MRLMRCSRVLVVFLGVLQAGAGRADAEIVTFHFQFQVDVAGSPFGFSVNPGDIFNGSFSYDLATPNTSTQSWFGDYNQTLVDGFSIHIGGTQIASSDYLVRVFNGGNDGMELFALSPFSVGGTPSDSDDVLGLQVLSENTRWNTITLPETFDLSDLLQSDMRLSENFVGTIRGPVVGLELAPMISPGVDVGGSTGGGSGTTGGVDFSFDEVTTGGTFNAVFFQPTDDTELAALLGAEAAGLLDFQLATDPAQAWQLDFTGDFINEVTVTFGYDDTGLSPNQEAKLRVQHFVDGAWTTPSQQVFKQSNTIVVTVDSFSPFVLAIPEPSTWILSVMAAVGLLLYRTRAGRF